MRILLAEDDSRLGALVVHMLDKKAGWKTDWVQTGNEAYEQAFSEAYDVLILDWMMPGGSGTEICASLRRDGYAGAILMLTAKDRLEDRIEGLDSGADDYLVKPFELGELLARLRALTRRNYAPIREEQVRIGPLLLNRTGQSVEAGGETVRLTLREFQVLDLLAQNAGIVLSRELLLERIWGLEADVGPKTIDATVKLLRRKLSELGGQDLILSIRGVGYQIEK